MTSLLVYKATTVAITSFCLYCTVVPGTADWEFTSFKNYHRRPFPTKIRCEMSRMMNISTCEVLAKTNISCHMGWRQRRPLARVNSRAQYPVTHFTGCQPQHIAGITGIYGGSRTNAHYLLWRAIVLHTWWVNYVKFIQVLTFKYSVEFHVIIDLWYMLSCQRLRITLYVSITNKCSSNTNFCR